MTLPRLSWRREPHETGLAGVVQGERGWELRYGDIDVASVRPKTKGWDRWNIIGWMWSANCEELGIPWRNTSSTPVATPGEAKAQCTAYVKEHMRKPPSEEAGNG